MFCVLVTSGDNRLDIFNTCFSHSQRIWKDCPWPRYAGFTTPQPDQYGFKSLASYEVGDWCKSVTAHINALPPDIRYILLMVEDVLFMRPVDMTQLRWIAAETISNDFLYVRLVPLRRSWLFRLPPYHCHLELIPRNEPYYSSTEMVIWERNYLLKLLARPADAWSFEHHISERDHWVVSEPIFDQHQIVQKGRWNWDAPYLLGQLNLLVPRPYQAPLARWRGNWQNLNFEIFGYTSFRLKKWLGI